MYSDNQNPHFHSLIRLRWKTLLPVHHSLDKNLIIFSLRGYWCLIVTENLIQTPKQGYLLISPLMVSSENVEVSQKRCLGTSPSEQIIVDANSLKLRNAYVLLNLNIFKLFSLFRVSIYLKMFCFFLNKGFFGQFSIQTLFDTPPQI